MLAVHLDPQHVVSEMEALYDAAPKCNRHAKTKVISRVNLNPPNSPMGLHQIQTYYFLLSIFVMNYELISSLKETQRVRCCMTMQSFTQFIRILASGSVLLTEQKCLKTGAFM